MKNYYNRNQEWADGLVFWSHTDKLKCVIPLVQEINKSGLCFIDYYVWQWDISMDGSGFESVSSTAYGHNKQTDSAVDYGWSGNFTYAFYEDLNGTTAESSINPVYAKCKGHIVQKVEYAGNMSKNDYYASTSFGALLVLRLIAII